MLSVILLSVILLSVILLRVIFLSVILLGVIMLNVTVKPLIADCRYAEWHCSECHGAKFLQYELSNLKVQSTSHGVLTEGEYS